LSKIKSSTITSGSILATIDVSSLYTSIPHDEGLQAIIEVLEENGHTDPPVLFIAKLAELVLKNNVFRFKDQTYLQVRGTAMGTRMAPSYANLFMSKLEENFMANQPCLPETWLRFIDDIFIIWNEPEGEFLEFFNNLNKYHKTIKFTMEHSKEKIHFLDTTIYIKNECIHYEAYTKPTDAHLYLRYDSCHPRKTIESIPYSQILRMRRIHSEETKCQQSINRMTDNFKARRYPPSLLKKCTTMSAKTSSTTQTTSQTRKQKLILTLPFHPGLTGIKHIWERNLNILKQHPETSFLADQELIVAYRRPRNIKDRIVRTDIKPNQAQPGSNPCRQPKCQTCRFMKSTTEYTSNYTKLKYKIQGSYNCQTISVIYLITCEICGIQYVGQTGNTMNKRMVGHRFDIRHELDKPIPNHFGPNKEHPAKNLRITIIDKGEQDITTRILKETAYIRQLRTMEPFGLNIGQANI
jgi:hypothetical protein